MTRRHAEHPLGQLLQYAQLDDDRQPQPFAGLHATLVESFGERDGGADCFVLVHASFEELAERMSNGVILWDAEEVERRWPDRIFEASLGTEEVVPIFGTTERPCPGCDATCEGVRELRNGFFFMHDEGGHLVEYEPRFPTNRSIVRELERSGVRQLCNTLNPQSGDETYAQALEDELKRAERANDHGHAAAVRRVSRR